MASIYTVKEKILDTTGGGTSFAVLGWNNKEINKTILEQLNKFHHLDYKIFKDDNIEKLKILLSKAEHKLDAVYFSGSSEVRLVKQL